MSKRVCRAGRNKTRKKQREYKEYCRRQRLAGMTNDAHGGWKTANDETRKMNCAK